MDDLLGSVKLFATSFIPQDYLPCDGRHLNTAENAALYSLLGNRFGGDANVFCLPDLNGKEPAPEMCYGICVRGMYPTRP